MTLQSALRAWSASKTLCSAADLVAAAKNAWVGNTISDAKFREILAKVGLWANMEAAKVDGP